MTTTTPANVLFAISDTGGGHRSAAVAIRAALEQAAGDRLSCEIVDMLRITNVPVIRNSPRIYDQLSTRWLRIYDAGYQLTDGVRRVDVLSRLVYVQARHSIIQTLRAVQPQLVVMTHPLPQRLIGSARRANRFPFRLVTVVTDLVSFHASWTYAGVDLCLLPTDEAYDLMRRRQMPEDLMVRTGFPVHPKFAACTFTRHEARHTLGLAADRFTMLVTSGGVGSGNMHELVLALEQRYPEKQLLVVTGKNAALYEQLRAEARNPHTHVYGFVDNMEVLMAASDVIVTKAGPGTLMEALVMQRPVLVTEAVGMQERGNIDFVVNHELGFFCPTVEQIVAATDRLTDPACYETTARRLIGAVPRDGAAQIARILLDQLDQVGTTPVHKPRRVLRLGRWSRVLLRRRQKS